jgi:hypothetical protein
MVMKNILLFLIVCSVPFAFADGVLNPKWSITIGNPRNYQVLPVMEDIDGDGVTEIVMAVGSNVIAVDGRTGRVEWNRTGSAATAIELVDLNNDGRPEVLYGTSSNRLRALRGDGTTLWTSQTLPGSIQALFPIVAHDIDGDGYPEIYFASGDVTPTPYSGNDSDYNGAISMLDHNGRLLRTTYTHHPCWGGLSLADYNNDGEFELYVGDRRNGYLGFPAMGAQAYNAHTLERYWARPDLQHSSPMIVLADVLGDDDLEVIGQPITMRGPIIMDPATGANIIDYSDRRLPTHATPSVYDIDGDGNMEILFGTSYPTSAPRNIVVFDLITGQIDFERNFSMHTTWPPRLGDVTGDGKLEIIATMGEQGSLTGNFPIYVFNSEYELIDTIYPQGAGQLMPALIGDSDGDGLNEVIVAGINGRLLAYDTNGRTPSPAPRTGVQFYSEYRQGASIYVPPPGSDPVSQEPVLADESPEDGSVTGANPLLSIYAYDNQQELIDLRFEINSGSGWQLLREYNDVPHGRYTAQTSTQPDRTYQWRVIADDNNGHSVTETFSFTTESASTWPLPGWDHRKRLTVDSSRVYGDLSGFPMLVKLDDADLAEKAQSDGDDIVFALQDGTLLSHEIESYADGELAAWVRVPQLSSSQDTDIFMYYGNAAAGSQENPTAVWDSGYLAVHHLSETSGTIQDSTERDNDGTPLNGLSQDVVGQIVGADRFDGSDDRIVMPRLFTNQAAFTIEGWANPASKHGYIFSQRNTGGSGAFVQYYPPEGNFQVYANNRIARVSADPNEWHHVVATFDSGTLRLYVDGNSPAEVTGASIAWPNLQSLYGDRAALGRAFQGTLDEMRISGIARSEAYVRTSYANQNAPLQFYSVGPEE